MIFYYVIQEFLFNTTIGKSVFKLMVISVNTGEKLTLSDVIIRTLSRFIPLDVFFFFKFCDVVEFSVAELRGVVELRAGE